MKVVTMEGGESGDNGDGGGDEGRCDIERDMHIMHRERDF